METNSALAHHLKSHVAKGHVTASNAQEKLFPDGIGPPLAYPFPSFTLSVIIQPLSPSPVVMHPETV